MECACDYDWCDPPEFVDVTTPTARKEHKCCSCGATIKPGEKYEYVSGVWDGDFDHFKTCLACVEVRDSVCGRFGDFWRDECVQELFAEADLGQLEKYSKEAVIKIEEQLGFLWEDDK